MIKIQDLRVGKTFWRHGSRYVVTKRKLYHDRIWVQYVPQCTAINTEDPFERMMDVLQPGHVRYEMVFLRKGPFSKTGVYETREKSIKAYPVWMEQFGFSLVKFSVYAERKEYKNIWVDADTQASHIAKLKPCSSQ